MPSSHLCGIVDSVDMSRKTGVRLQIGVNLTVFLSVLCQGESRHGSIVLVTRIREGLGAHHPPPRLP